jgi:outer membrane protein assembly factor BamB
MGTGSVRGGSSRRLGLRSFLFLLSPLVAAAPAAAAPAAAADPGDPADPGAALARIDLERGICAVLGLPAGAGPEFVTELARRSELTLYFQSWDAEEVEGVQKAADRAGLLGTRIFAARAGGERPGLERIALADDIAGALIATGEAAATVGEVEALRVLHPGGKGFLGERVVIKARPEGADAWSHPFHGPDNNPQSLDRVARAPYLTQFLAEPLFVPMPEISVAAGGRVFRAFGHIAHKANQNAMLNTVIAANAYNGIILWKRPLAESFMIHRNTLVATPETLYLADSVSLKRIDAASGDVRSELVVPEGLGDGPVWKWLAIEEGVIYALVGGREVEIPTQRSRTPGLGHWPWGMWPGHDYADPRTSFGFGRTLVAFDDASGKVLWSRGEEDHIDSRGVCMKNGRIFFYSPGKHLACLSAEGGKVLWRASDPELLAAIGPNRAAQHYVTGYATTAYVKCTGRQVFFAGPQRDRLVVADALSGKLLWQRPHGNLQLVLREDGIYAAGPELTGRKLAYENGEELAALATRRACTRATGSIDSVFYRTTGGTVRLDVESGASKHIAPMRPPCQDGVIIAEGHLYWGPWMCGCQLSLYGHIALGPARGHDFSAKADPSRLEAAAPRAEGGPRLAARAGDWLQHRADSRRSATTTARLSRRVREAWTWKPPAPRLPSAPVAAGGLVFVGDRAGAVRALDAKSGAERWCTYTGGAVYCPPAVADGSLFAGSADGQVYALDGATGRLLWRFRLAPLERRIPVYGALVSTWPVAGGVAVEDGVVYAAAGIAHYDGTYVAALDARTGAVRWEENASGVLSDKVGSGISLQGELSLEDGEVRFAGGGVYRTARYDMKTGECLNARELHEEPTSRFQTAFFAYYPDYAQYASLRHELPGGRTLEYEASYEASRHSDLALLGPPPAGGEAAGGRGAPEKAPDRARERRRSPPRETLWKRGGFAYNAHAITSEDVLLAEQSLEGGATSSGGAIPGGGGASLTALSIEDGAPRWRFALPEPAVRDGLAVDAGGRIYAALSSGAVLCLEGLEGLEGAEPRE